MKKLKSLIYNFLQFFITRYKYHFVLNQRQKQKVLSTKYNLSHNLTSDNIVFEVGGYKGDWSEKIFEKYNSNIYIFEPVKSYYDFLVERFKNNSKIRVFHFGLSDKTETQKINLLDDGSSLYKKGTKTETIKLVSLDEFMKKNSISKIDLMQMNIEGGEFPLLKHAIEKDLLKKIVKLQIQFHNVDKDSEKNRDKIQSALHKTHKIIYDFPFLWESWILK